MLSSMLSGAAEEGLVPHNPFLLRETKGRRGRARKVARSAVARNPRRSIRLPGFSSSTTCDGRRDLAGEELGSVCAATNWTESSMP